MRKAAIEVPDWVKETPDESSYDLTMWSGGGKDDAEHIGIERDEYIALKARLAEIRGYVTAETSNDTEPAANGIKSRGEALAVELQETVHSKAVCEFEGWAERASVRDLQTITEILSTALNLRTYREFDASLMCGISSVLGREFVVHCPMGLIGKVQDYIEELTANKAA